MRTVFARLIALGAISLVVGCSGNSTNPLPPTSELNNGGSPGSVTGNTTGTPGQTGTLANSTDSRNNSPALPVTATSFVFAAGTAGYQYTVQYTAAGAFTITPNAAGTIGVTLTQSVTPPAGIAAFPLPAQGAGATPAAVLQYGQLTPANGTITGKNSPNLVITGVTVPAGHASVNLGVFNTATTSWVALGACTVSANLVNCPVTALPSTFTYPAAGPFTFAIYTI